MSIWKLAAPLLIGAALSSRRKRHSHAFSYLTGAPSISRGLGGGALRTAGVALGAAGLAYGAYQLLQSRRAGQRVTPGTTVVGGLPPEAPDAGLRAAEPPPLPGAATVADESRVSPDDLRMIRLTIAAARADGQLSDHERGTLLAGARQHGIEDVVRAEIERPAALAAIAGGVGDPIAREKLYQVAFGIVRADSNVTGSERVFLASLAAALGLDAAAVARLESESAGAIDAQPG
jgi:uncharacterized membrane protein YebE (DUF533 family)